MNAEPVVCAAVNQDDTCTNRTLLFTLKQGSDADATLKKLPKVDLTVVEFTNSQKYSVAKIATQIWRQGRKLRISLFGVRISIKKEIIRVL
jgi:hypothetical protein